MEESLLLKRRFCLFPHPSAPAAEPADHGSRQGLRNSICRASVSSHFLAAPVKDFLLRGRFPRLELDKALDRFTLRIVRYCRPRRPGDLGMFVQDYLPLRARIDVESADQHQLLFAGGDDDITPPRRCGRVSPVSKYRGPLISRNAASLVFAPFQ
jgi:hypothetical protein